MSHEAEASAAPPAVDGAVRLTTDQHRQRMLRLGADTGQTRPGVDPLDTGTAASARIESEVLA